MIEASVVICAYTLDRWDQLKEAIASVRSQTYAPRDIILVIDRNEELRQRAACEFTGVTVVANSNVAGLSGGRMTGAEFATAPVIAYIDDDAIADRCWLEELLKPYADPRVLGVGGYIEPLWSRPAPPWFSAEFNWIIGCTYAGMPVRDGRIRNPIGTNMSMRAEVLHRAGGFTAELGRGSDAPSSIPAAGTCDETDLCIRAARLYPGGYWAYSPTARVRHHVTAERMTWGYFVRRCRMEGASKAVVTRLNGARQGLGSERRYVLSLGRAVMRELAAFLAGEPNAGRRAGAICAGLAITSFAFLHARVMTMLARPAPAAVVAAGAAAPPRRVGE